MKRLWLVPSMLGTACCLVAANCSREADRETPAASSVPTIEIDSNDVDFDDEPPANSSEDY